MPSRPSVSKKREEVNCVPYVVGGQRHVLFAAARGKKSAWALTYRRP
jgi:hypothetical protein